MRSVSFCLLILLLAAPSAFSHVYLLECSPAEDGVVETPPEKVSVTFAGSVEPAFSKLEVFDSEGTKVSGKTVFLENDTVMEAPVTGTLKPGTYTVRYICMSLDGHKQTGEYFFTVK